MVKVETKRNETNLTEKFQGQFHENQLQNNTETANIKI